MARQYYGEEDDPNNPYDDSQQYENPDVNAPIPGVDTGPGPTNDQPVAPSPSGGGTGGGGTNPNEHANDAQSILDFYAKNLPNARAGEAGTDIANLQKYGYDSGPYGGILAQLQARLTNKPGPDNLTGGKGTGGAGTGADGSSAMLQALLQSILSGGALSGINQSGYQESAQNQALRTQMMEALRQLFAEGSQPVGDVSNTPQARANQIATQREYEHNRSAAAERRASQGLLYSGPFEQDIEGAQQQRAEKQGAFEAQIVQTILQDRKERLLSALQMSAGIVSEDQRVGLQRELQQVNAALQQTQLKLMLAGQLFQNQQFYDQLGYTLGGQEGAANAGAVVPGGG